MRRNKNKTNFYSDISHDTSCIFLLSFEHKFINIFSKRNAMFLKKYVPFFALLIHAGLLPGVLDTTMVG